MNPQAAQSTANLTVTNLIPVNGQIPLAWFLILSILLFTIGAVGVLVKRNPIVIFMCVEMMLNAVNLSFISFGRYLGDPGGQMFTIFVMAVAAAEVAVGLGILLSIFRSREDINVDEVSLLKG